MDLFWLILALGAVVGLALLVLFGFGRMAWRVLRGGEEMEPGGSYSRQTLGRYKDGQTPDDEVSG